MNRMSEIAENAEKQLVIFLQELDEEYRKLRNPIEAALTAIRARGQAELIAKPVEPLAQKDNGTGANGGGHALEIPLTNVSMVKEVVAQLPNEFNVLMIYRAFEHRFGTKLNRRQINTAFGKFAARRDSGLALHKRGSGNEPHTYRKEPIA